MLALVKNLNIFKPFPLGLYKKDWPLYFIRPLKKNLTWFLMSSWFQIPRIELIVTQILFCFKIAVWNNRTKTETGKVSEYEKGKDNNAKGTRQISPVTSG